MLFAGMLGLCIRLGKVSVIILQHLVLVAVPKLARERSGLFPVATVVFHGALLRRLIRMI